MLWIVSVRPVLKSVILKVRSFHFMFVIRTETFEVTKLAFDEGIFINPVIPPACAPQDTLVRVALMATHTKEQVDYAVDKLTKCFKKLEIIK